MTDELRQVTELVKRRNAIDSELARIIGRPVTAGHLGEWISSHIFDIELERSASTAAIDGHFRSGPLRGRSVNIKWYGKREGILDLTPAAHPDFYLVLTGPAGPAGSSRRGIRPLCVAAVYLFDALRLLAELRERGVRIGVASSVRAAQWDRAQIYPGSTNPLLPLSREQSSRLAMLAPAEMSPGLQ